MHVLGIGEAAASAAVIDKAAYFGLGSETRFKVLRALTRRVAGIQIATGRMLTFKQGRASGSVAKKLCLSVVLPSTTVALRVV